MKNYLLLTFSFVAFNLISFSQQDPQFSQNMFNRLYVNPGVAGSNNAICATLFGRHQWMGFEGQPKTYLLSIHAPVNLLHGGIGLNVVSDELGQEKTFGIKASYAFRKSIGTGDIGIGAAAGMINKSIGKNWIATDGVAQDQRIPANGAADTGLDFDFGLYYKNPSLYVGISTTHLSQSQLKEASGNVNFSYMVARHYYIMAGYNYSFQTIPITLQPMVYVKSDGSSAQLDLNGIVMYNNLLWAGVSYRMNDAIVPMIGVQKDLGQGTLKFGYSYDLTTSLLKQYSSGSHELMLGYCYKVSSDSKTQKHKTVRFL